MLMYPHMNPVAVRIGPLRVHWYGLMYLFGFVAAWLLATYRSRQRSDWSSEQVSDLIFYAALGVVIGGRLGFMLFYGWEDLVHQPLSLFRVWDGGMSFHGGCVGVAISTWFFASKNKKRWLSVTDFSMPFVPVGLAAGRLGNFINGELWGRVTNVPWAMIFPHAGPLPRHPSQLYELTMEGVILFFILWIYSSKSRPQGAVSALFLLLYGIIRFILEFFRQPDPQLGFVAFGWMTRGQELSIPMMVIGLVVLLISYKRSCYD